MFFKRLNELIKWLSRRDYFLHFFRIETCTSRVWKVRLLTRVQYKLIRAWLSFERRSPHSIRSVGWENMIPNRVCVIQWPHVARKTRAFTRQVSDCFTEWSRTLIAFRSRFQGEETQVFLRGFFFGRRVDSFQSWPIPHYERYRAPRGSWILIDVVSEKRISMDSPRFIIRAVRSSAVNFAIR